MTLIRWDPYRELSNLQDRMNRLFQDTWSGPGTLAQRGEESLWALRSSRPWMFTKTTSTSF